jgi:hypothetical protein
MLGAASCDVSRYVVYACGRGGVPALQNLVVDGSVLVESSCPPASPLFDTLVGRSVGRLVGRSVLQLDTNKTKMNVGEKKIRSQKFTQDEKSGRG